MHLKLGVKYQLCVKPVINHVRILGDVLTLRCTLMRDEIMDY